MQVTNTLNIDISTEIKAPSASSASGADRDFSSVLDTQTTSTSNTSDSRPQSRSEARSATSSSRAETEKNSEKSDNKAEKVDASAPKDELASSEQIVRDEAIDADKPEADNASDDESDLKESAEDLSQLAPDAADAQPTIDPALTGIDFLQHLQTSLTTNTDLARTSDCVVSEDGDTAADDAAIDGNSLPPVLVDASEDEGALLGEAALAVRARAKEGSAVVNSEPKGETDGSTAADSSLPESVDEPVVAAVAVTGQEKPTVVDNSSQESVDEAVAGTVTATAQEKPTTASSRDSSAEVAQLAALFAGGSKREVASTAAAATEKTVTSLDAAAEEAAASSDAAGELDPGQSGATSVADGALPESASHVKSLSESVRSSATTEAGSAYQQILQRGAADGAEATAQGRDKSMLFSAVHLANAQQAAPELAQRMTLMIGQKWHEAEIQLEPQGLGKMNIQLSIDQDQKANVQFVVQQGNARELLEQALPKLRDMLASQGVQLGQTSVQQQAAGQQQSQGQLAQQGQGRGEGGSGWQRGQNSQGEAVDVQNLAIHSTGAAGIDFYA